MKSPGMKLLFVDQSGGLYGSERGLLELLAPDFTAAQQVTVACQPGAGLSDELRRRRIAQVPLDFRRPSFRRRPDAAFRLLRRFHALLRRERPDCVVINFEGSVPILVSACRLAGVPVIRLLKREVHPPGSPAPGYQLTTLDRLAFQACQGVICISNAVADQLRQALSRWSPTIVALYDPQEVLEPLPAEVARWRTQLLGADGTHLIGLFARVHPMKGIDVLLQAAPSLLQVQPGARFVVAGDADSSPAGQAYRHELERQARELGLSEVLSWAGFVEEPQALMAACDVTVLPTRAEGLGRVLLESWAVGTPVIASDVGGPGEVVRSSGGGRLHQVGDAAGLARSLAELLGDPTLRETLADRGRSWLRQECDPLRYRQQFLAALQRLVGVGAHA